MREGTTTNDFLMKYVDMAAFSPFSEINQHVLQVLTENMKTSQKIVAQKLIFQSFKYMKY